jgi:hypothetical protein
MIIIFLLFLIKMARHRQLHNPGYVSPGSRVRHAASRIGDRAIVSAQHVAGQVGRLSPMSPAAQSAVKARVGAGLSTTRRIVGGAGGHLAKAGNTAVKVVQLAPGITQASALLAKTVTPLRFVLMGHAAYM